MLTPFTTLLKTRLELPFLEHACIHALCFLQPCCPVHHALDSALRLLGQASRLVAHAAEVKEQADAPPATQSGADEYYEVRYTAQASKMWCVHTWTSNKTVWGVRAE